ncbi:tRNA/tmRNA/rRNA uracil-C5-methylase (TrmA/RlmC/RlmD family) [Jatrophihabitans sp. GAS493]|uniref:class I SAM-dependent RNA methyltransferase n=1 Tax=Jatrophihabitans sp. GAS493 TaxID=1907575 RepID=UPI000BC0573E|nr:TRAM domain-containing protein [Jatrophihabitans sp. GAS493]SOD74077.1 tRNA/tmRNA/rRNA uracil-C5-methylase (TrmA/RlmC/RlmD family) [Jatrophihabitans sp. GAS493]
MPTDPRTSTGRDDVTAPFAVGHRLRLRVTAVAHGGHCVARVDDDPHGRVVFVRHTLPGEVVEAAVTEDSGGAFLRADAVEILQAATERVAPPCPHAGAGRCGGCDWQHVTAGGQRELKRAVVGEQFARLAQLEVDAEVEELAGGLLGWRTRTLYATTPGGEVGLRRHRSHTVEVLDHCPLGVHGVGDSEVLQEPWPGISGLELVQDGPQAITLLTHRPAPRPSGRRGSTQRGGGQRHHRRQPDVVSVHSGSPEVTRPALGRSFSVAAAGFWQVHPLAAETFARAMLDGLAPAAGEVVLDLYAGAGLFTALIGERVGLTGRVIGLEADRQAVADAETNLADLPWCSVRQGKVSAELIADVGAGCDLVVLDPPRSGAGREIMLAALQLRPRLIGYLACDPSSLARDVATAREAGWELRQLRAFDAFPMTHHLECLAVLAPTPTGEHATSATGRRTPVG